MRVAVGEVALYVERVDGADVTPEVHRAALAEALDAAVSTIRDGSYELAALRAGAHEAALAKVERNRALEDLDRARHEIMDRDRLLQNEHACYAREHEIAEAWKALAAARTVPCGRRGARDGEEAGVMALLALGIDPDAP